MALFSTLTDNFDDGVVGPLWEGSSAEVIEVGGRARIPSADGYPSLRTPAIHSLVGSSVYAKIFPAPKGTSTGGVTSEMLVDSPTGGTRLIIQVNTENNEIVFRSDVGYGDAGSKTLAYNPISHRWWRMREAAGQVYMETSPDANTWTVQRQVATPAWITTGNNPLIFSTHRGNGDFIYYMEVDNLNTPQETPVIPDVPANVSVTPYDSRAEVYWIGDDQATEYEIEYQVVEAPVVEERTVQPWTPVTLTSAEAGSWTQVAGSAIALGGSGSTRTFTAPPSMNNQVLEFAFGSKTFTINIPRASHGIKVADGSVTPIRFSGKGSTGPAPVVIDAGVSAGTKVFTASDAMIANPERGWYQYTETSWVDAGGTGFTPLNSADIVTRRTSSETINGYSVPPRSIVFRYYVMGHMRNTDTIPAAFLTALQNDFNAVRDAGAKMLVRFSYSNDGTTGSNTDGNGPYGTDTTPARTLSHIAQLKSTMANNSDVIHAIQAGFIGTWGEWYYTDYWGNKGTLTQTDWDNRAQLISALLDWTTNVPVLLRYVGLKQRFIREVNGSTDAIERLGFHNDAFMASEDNADWGTFATFADGMSVQQARDYLATEVARGLPMVGETAGVSSRSTYASTAASLAEHRWSALNPNYHPDVLASWSSTDKDEVSRRLGYRLRLVSLKLAETGTANASVPLEFVIANDGWGNPLSKRPIQIVFVNGETTVTRTLTKDIRTLGPGTHTVSENITLPDSNGTFSVHLAMPDMNASLATRAEYAIRLANTTGWANGRNDLGTTVAVSGAVVAPTFTITPDSNDAGTFTTNVLVDTNDPGTFGAGLTADTSDVGTFLLAGSGDATQTTRLKPTSATQTAMDTSVRTLWTNWKTNIVQNTANGWYAVKADAQKDPVTGIPENPYVAEGQGYGLMAAVQMADIDANAKVIFDGITKYVLDHPSNINPNLHAAEQNAEMVTHNGGDSATDGDMDIAYAHLLAHKKWGSAGTYNYLQLATTRINAIKQSIISPVTGLLELGDWSTGTWENYSRPSDWMIGHFEAFYAATGDATWETAKNAHLSSIERLQATYAPATGLLPDFTQNPPATIAPAGPNLLESENDGDYYYNACRTPWRLGTASSQVSRDAALKMATWAKTKCNGNPATLPSGYKLDGTTIGNYQDLSFIAPFAVGASCGTDQAWLNSLWDYLAARSNNTDYYGGSIQLLCMIAISGTYVVNP